MIEPGFEASVFINCPFDTEYDAILQAILFSTIYLGLTPRIARERNDSGEARLEKIKFLIGNSKFSMHDLSRSIARRKGEHSRHNMPFELGIDYGCRQFSDDHRREKKFLVLSEKPYDYMKSLSDLSGCDIEAHAGDYQKAVGKVRNWLVNEADAPRKSPSGYILRKYVDFQEWHYEEQLAAGFSDDDIKDYPTKELMESMQKWLGLGEPV